MNRFVSNFASRLDAKGRVSIPAPFRAVLARDGFEGLYVHPALDAPALDAGGNTLMAEIEAFLLGFSPYSEERDRLATALYGTSEILKVDPEGRAVLTESLKSHAGIADAVAFVGLGHKFQIWEPNAFAAHLSEARTKVRELRKSWGAGAPAPGAPAGAPR
ncbi:MAG: division/cell wall cluster transcriptional repressor MraZ [Microvirga sp.]|jgi:MraZ protein|nr:division/cell wall cluster transcriptional repressor MraZ [Beijerinckiaceae bacterium]